MNLGSISGICQSNQTTIIENEWLRNAAKLIEKGKLDAERVVFYKQITDTLNSRISGLLAVIELISERDTAQLRVILQLQKEIQNLLSQKETIEKEMKHQNKLYRRQKLKTVFVTVGAAGVTAAAFIIFKL